MRRPLLALVLVIVAIGVFAAGLAWLLDSPRPAPGASHPERLWLAFCAACHGADGRGTWRAALFLVRAGDLTDRSRVGQTDQYLFDLVKHGGSPIGRPGMPGFEANLSDEDIRALVGYLRELARRVTPPARS